MLCPFCGENMVEARDGKIAVLPMCGNDKVKINSKGDASFRLPAAVGSGSYLPGIDADCLKCEGCGYIAIFERKDQ